MGQYHKTISLDGGEYLDPYPMGSMIKAWEQVVGGVPAALTALLAYKPGNMPADLGNHPDLIGRWAGHRLMVVGDYAERGDIKGFRGPAPLTRIYQLCGAEMPDVETFNRMPPRIYYKQGGSKASDRRYLDHTKPIRRIVETGAMRFQAAMKDFNRTTDKGKYPIIPSISESMLGLLEDALSIRFCSDEKDGDHRMHLMVPVKAMAERGPDGHLHYTLADSVRRDREHLGYIWRMLGFGGTDPKPNPNRLPFGVARWPWDRAPMSLSHHSVRDKDADVGQTRVFANLDRREFVDPIKFGEQPTTAGIMRASAGTGEPRMAIDMMISTGGLESNVKTGALDFGCASAVWAMLLHPESRGGGDVEPEQFPQIGRWRHNRLVLTSEWEGEFPTTDEVKATFTDISGDVVQATAMLGLAA